MAAILSSQKMLRKVFDSKLRMQTNMNDFVELMSIIGTLENQRRKDIGQGFTGYSMISEVWGHIKLQSESLYEEIIERMYYYTHW